MTDISIEGIYDRDWPYNWHPRIGTKTVETYVRDRLAELPQGAYVRITIEVLDPHPEIK